MIKEYDVFLKGKQIFKIKDKNRVNAVKKAKNWFYKQIEKGRIKNGVQARKALSVSDNYEEVTFDTHFNTAIDKNNFLRPEDVDRVIECSGGFLKKATKKDFGKGNIRQLTRTKNRFPGKKVLKLASLPYIYYSRVGSVFYAIKSLSERGKRVTKLIKINNSSISSMVEEIRDRRLYKQDKSPNAKKKIDVLILCVGCIRELTKAVSFFSWGGVSSLSFVYDRGLKKQLKVSGSKIHYNPNFGEYHDLKSTVRNIRKEILENESKSFKRN